MSKYAEAHGGIGHPAHDVPVRVGTTEHYIRRTFDLMRRLEAGFGPLGALQARLWARNITADDLVKLYMLVLEDERFKDVLPQRQEVIDHVWQVGILRAVEPMSLVVSCLFIGNEKAADLLKGGDGKPLADPTTGG